MKKENHEFKFPIQLDLAYFVIYWSITVAIFCFGVSAILEVTRFNVVALILFIITLILVYLGTGFSASFNGDLLVCSYFRGLRKKTIHLKDVKEVILTDKEQQWFFMNQTPPVSLSVEEKLEDQMMADLKEVHPHISILDNRKKPFQSNKKVKKQSFIMNILK